MLSGWSIILISLGYLSLLFAIAYFGDKSAERNKPIFNRPVVYSLSLAVYCSSWTFYGAVGRATTSGWEFLATYLGPILVFIFAWRLIEKMILVSKQQNITTISDFISSRYGKSQALAVLITIIAVTGTINATAPSPPAGGRARPQANGVGRRAPPTATTSVTPCMCNASRPGEPAIPGTGAAGLR